MTNGSQANGGKVLQSILRLWPILLFLFVQTGGAAWWASGLTAKVDQIEAHVAQNASDLYRVVDAERDLRFRDQLISDLRADLRVVFERVRQLEVTIAGLKVEP